MKTPSRNSKNQSSPKKTKNKKLSDDHKKHSTSTTALLEKYIQWAVEHGELVTLSGIPL